MSNETKLDSDLVLHIPIRGYIDNLSAEDRAHIITAVAMDKWFLNAVVDQLVEGMTDTEWSFDETFYTELRLKIAENMEPVGIRLIRELAHERDAAMSNEARHVKWAWELYRQWVDGRQYNPPPIPSFVYTTYMDEAKAMELLLAERAVTP